MTSFYEQPYTLIGLAIIVLFGLFTYRSVFPEKCNRKQWLIPLSVVVLALGLDFLVKTDREKLSTLIDTIMTAIKKEDYAAIESAIAEDYQDSYHKSKPAVMARCRRTLENIDILSNRITSWLPDITPPTARVTIFSTIRFGKNSWVTQSYKSVIFFKAQINFAKQPNKSWKITGITPLEVDKYPINWSQIRQ